MIANPQFAKEHEANQSKSKEELTKVLHNGNAVQRRNQIIIPVTVYFLSGNETK